MTLCVALHRIRNCKAIFNRSNPAKIFEKKLLVFFASFQVMLKKEGVEEGEKKLAGLPRGSSEKPRGTSQ